MGTASNINVSILQMGKIKAWRINCQKFLEWSFANVWSRGMWHRRRKRKVMLAAGLLSHLSWPSWGSKECVGTALLGWLDFESQWSLSTLSSLEKKNNLILHYLKTTKKIIKHINVHNKRISIFSLCIIFPATNMFLEARGNIYPKPQTCNH